MTNEQLKILLSRYAALVNEAHEEVVDNFPEVEEKGETLFGFPALYYPKISRLCELGRALREDIEALSDDTP